MEKPGIGLIKAAGYIRVSSKEQIEGESLSTQRQSIKDFAKQQGWKLTEVYADEGISGGSVEKRHALLRCLHDGRNGKFNILVIHRLSRFGRNARELLINHDQLEKAGIQLRSISEGIDFGNKYGKAMLGMFAVMAELEKDIIRETMLENRIAKGRKGIPTAGPSPTARKFNKTSGQWELDYELASLLKKAAERYLKDGRLRDIANEFRKANRDFPSYEALIRVFRNNCGDTWTVRFKNEEPITYKVPRILEEDIIQQLRDRLDFNRKCRGDVRKYALQGFIHCKTCNRSLSGQTQFTKSGLEYQYYLHPAKNSTCKSFHSIPLKPIERAVFRTIFENTVDAPAFEKAIAESLPDEKQIKSLHEEIHKGEKELRRINKELEKLVEAYLSQILKKETIKSKENSLLESRDKIQSMLDENRARLRSMPDLNEMKQKTEIIRRQLMEHYGSPERLQNMSYNEKQNLLHWLFDGKDQNGFPYGIYVHRHGLGRNKKIDYFMYGRITGLRTLKGEDIDYQGWDEDENEYKTPSAAGMR
jgi:site-specific DNA recombinase